MKSLFKNSFSFTVIVILFVSSFVPRVSHAGFLDWLERSKCSSLCESIKKKATVESCTYEDDKGRKWDVSSIHYPSIEEMVRQLTEYIDEYEFLIDPEDLKEMDFESLAVLYDGMNMGMTREELIELIEGGLIQHLMGQCTIVAVINGHKGTLTIKRQ